MAEPAAKSIYNFCSGPAMLPLPVMQKAQREFLNYQQKGISVLEMSHRSDEFLSILATAEADFRSLLAIPEEYAVLFMQGGASLQFSAVPQNLLSHYQTAGYLNTGYWSQKAISEATHFGEVESATVSFDSDTDYSEAFAIEFDRPVDYVHFTPNETIDGIEIGGLPSTDIAPLVADMSSNILSRVIDVSKFGVIYAGAQKNIGPAGLGIVIVKKSLLGKAMASTPRLLNYQIVHSQNSMANTPPTYAIYLAGLVFKWLKEQGGVAAIEERNRRKAAKLYNAIDESELICNGVGGSLRSRMNVPFVFYNESLTSKFITDAAAAGLLNLGGHRSRGGCRASIYNAMPEQGVDQLIEFIQDFEKKHV